MSDLVMRACRFYDKCNKDLEEEGLSETALDSERKEVREIKRIANQLIVDLHAKLFRILDLADTCLRYRTDQSAPDALHEIVGIIAGKE